MYIYIIPQSCIVGPARSKGSRPPLSHTHTHVIFRSRHDNDKWGRRRWWNQEVGDADDIDRRGTEKNLGSGHLHVVTSCWYYLIASSVVHFAALSHALLPSRRNVCFYGDLHDSVLNDSSHQESPTIITSRGGQGSWWWYSTPRCCSRLVLRLASDD